MLMQSLVRAGLTVGDDLLPPGPSNPDGHFEDTQIVQLHDAELDRVSGNWYQPAAEPIAYSYKFDSSIDTVLESYRIMDSHWGFKDPRTVLFLPYWQHKVPMAKHVFIYRHPAACVRSLLKRQTQDLVYNPSAVRDQMYFLKEPDIALRIWIHYNRNILTAIEQIERDVITVVQQPRIKASSLNQRCLMISYEQVLSKYPLIETVNEVFGLQLDATVDIGVRNANSAATGEASLPYKFDADLLDEANRVYEALHKQATRLSGWEELPTEPLTSSYSARKPAMHDQVDKNSIRQLAEQLGLSTEACEDHPASLPPASVESSDASTPDPLDAQKNIEAGLSAMQAGQYEKANLFLKAAHTVNTDAPAPLMFLGLVALRQTNYIVAQQYFDQALQRQTDNANLYCHAARALFLQGKFEAALQYCIQGRVLNEDDEELCVLEIDCLVSLCQFAEASRACEAAMQKFPDNWPLVMNFYHLQVAGKHRRPDAMKYFYQAMFIRMRSFRSYLPVLEAAIDDVHSESSREQLVHDVTTELERFVAYFPSERASSDESSKAA